MNRFETILDSVRHFSKLLGHMGFVALEINKTAEETKDDFINSKRTGQSALVVHHGLSRVSGHYVPDSDFEEKIRYSIVANNKVNFLLQNPERVCTFAQSKEEKVQFESVEIFGGGIRVKEPQGLLIAVSGFHPKIDEACSIVSFSQLLSLATEKARLYHLKESSVQFTNPYALAIAAGFSFVKSITFDQAIEWGKNEIK